MIGSSDRQYHEDDSDKLEHRYVKMRRRIAEVRTLPIVLAFFCLVVSTVFTFQYDLASQLSNDSPSPTCHFQ